MHIHTIYSLTIWPMTLGRPRRPASSGLKRPQTASDGLSRGNLSKNQYFGQKS